MPRIHAYHILNRYFLENSYLNITLNDVLEKSHLSRLDKDLCTHIVYGTIQYKLYLEYLLEPFIQGKKVKTKVKTILLMSLYQFEFLNKIPEYAIIHEAVELGKKDSYNTGKFINAILRNYLRHEKRSLDSLDELTRLSIETSHPLWLIKMLKKQYGITTTKKICYEDNQPPLRHARVNTLKTTKERLLQEKGIVTGKLSQDAILFEKGNIAQTSFYQNGLVTIQDESSQLVGRLLQPQPGDYVLDMCCAPGSKTTHLAALMNNQGKIEAYDLFEHKIKLVQKNCQRLGVTNVFCHQYDATELKDIYLPETFDCILLDAPCSGLGVLKRKPEIKYHDSSQMDTIIPLQAKLLENAYYLLKNNGKMVYSTCTINKKENEMMIQNFICRHPNMKIVMEKTILNYQYGSDGFFMCKLIKENENGTHL